MKKTFTYLLGGALFALFLLMPSSAGAADFEDFSIIINNESGTILTEAEMAAQGNAVNFGVAVVESIVSRVEVTNPSSIATISGNYHSDHGVTNFQCVVAVPGPVKITLGNCTYGGHEASYQPEGGDKVVFSTTASCWKNNHSDVTEVYYTGSATTLTIKGAGYTPYFAIEETVYVPNNKTVTFGVGTSGATGVVPEAQTKDINLEDELTIPTNYSLYIAGKTLTGWTDGVNTYNIGDTYTITDDVTLTPVFTSNTTTLNDRVAATTVHWEFRKNQGVPLVGWEGSSGFLVGQADINGTKIDVKMDIDATSGKFNNSNGDWSQVNPTTNFTMPICKDAEFTTYTMSTTAKGTFDGVAGGTNDSYNLNYTYTGSGSSMVVGLGDATWYKYIEVTYPAQPTRTITIGPAKYATYYSNIAYTLPENLQAATVDENSGGTLTLNYRYKKDDVVPGGTAVLLKATAAGDYTLTMQPADATAAPAGNLLHGSDVETTTTGGDKYYALMYGKGEKSSVLGFYWVNESGAAFTSPAHKAWLALSDGGANFFSLEDDVTGINMVKGSELKVNGEYYNLAGQRVMNPTKGLYIVNGKKVIIK